MRVLVLLLILCSTPCLADEQQIGTSVTVTVSVTVVNAVEASDILANPEESGCFVEETEDSIMITC